MIKYGINTESRLWKAIPDLTAIEYMDADFSRYSKLFRGYFRHLPRLGADAIEVVGLGWQIVKRESQWGQPIEWFWIHIRAEFPSAEVRPYFVFQITATDKSKIHDPTWVSEVENHIEALRAEIRRKLGGDYIHEVWFVDEPRFVHDHFFTAWNDE